MINSIKEIGTYLNKFYECKNEELPLDFDYKNKLGMYFEVLNKINNGYKDVYSMEIHFISIKSKQLELLNLIETIDINLDNVVISEYWITRNNPYMIDTQDNEYEHWMLNYNINKF